MRQSYVKRLLPLLLILLSSCSMMMETSMSKTYKDEFMGFDVNYVTTVCGEPTTTRPDGSGGKVLVYEDIDRFIAATGTAVSKKGSIDGSFVQIYFNQEGKCYSVRTDHMEKHKVTDYKKSWLVVGSSLGGAVVATSIISLLINFSGRR